MFVSFNSLWEKALFPILFVLPQQLTVVNLKLISNRKCLFHIQL